MQRINFERAQKKGFGRGEPDEASLTGELKTVAELLGILDAALAGKQWIAGDLSLADFALATTFMLRKAAKLGVEAFPNVTAWIERLEATPGWPKAIATWRELMVQRRHSRRLSPQSGWSAGGLHRPLVISRRGRDVLVEPEQILRIVTALDLAQPLQRRGG